MNKTSVSCKILVEFNITKEISVPINLVINSHLDDLELKEYLEERVFPSVSKEELISALESGFLNDQVWMNIVSVDPKDGADHKI
jgi:hypothetical protein